LQKAGIRVYSTAGTPNCKKSTEEGEADAELSLADRKETSMASSKQKSSNRGFASMDEDKQREIAKKGGESVPDEKRSFSQDRELASEAGRKGGESVPDEKRSFSQDRELASEAGRKGGKESGGNFKNDPERASEAGRKGGESRSR
jgi:uncharacterized protein